MTFTWSRGRFPINVKLACGRSVGLGSSRSAAVADIMKNPVLSPAAFMRYVLDNGPRQRERDCSAVHRLFVILPETCPTWPGFDFVGSIGKVRFADDVVAVKDCPGLVSRYPHRYDLGHAAAVGLWELNVGGGGTRLGCRALSVCA